MSSKGVTARRGVAGINWVSSTVPGVSEVSSCLVGRWELA
jgi:hypothetical protein